MVYNPSLPNVYEDEEGLEKALIECRMGSRARKFKRRIQLIALKGGCCEKCGYSKAISALDFHHPDPGTKEFTLNFALRNFTNKQYEEMVIPHIKKDTVLLCANCHREEHWAKKK